MPNSLRLVSRRMLVVPACFALSLSGRLSRSDAFDVRSFNQYAQSHPFWSSDGRYLIYAERDRTLRDRVWLVDTKAEKGSDPIPVEEGSFGVWSWGPPGDPPAAGAND